MVAFEMFLMPFMYSGSGAPVVDGGHLAGEVTFQPRVKGLVTVEPRVIDSSVATEQVGGSVGLN